MVSNNLSTLNKIVSYQLNVVISISGNSNTVNILSFNETLLYNVIPDNNLTPTGCVTIEKPGINTSGLIALKGARRPRILAFNRTAGTVNGIPAYSVAVEPWDNTFSIANGDIVSFGPATNSIPSQTEEFGNGVFLGSSIFEAKNVVLPQADDIRILSQQVAAFNEFDQTALLLDQYTIKEGIELTTPSEGVLAVSSGKIEYKGIESSFSGENTAPSSKSLYKVFIDTNDSIILASEQNSDGSIVANYDCTVLPGSATPAWSGTYTEYSLNNVAGSSANGAAIEVIINHSASTENAFIEIDFGGGSTQEKVLINSERIQLDSNKQGYKLSLSNKTIHLKLVLNDTDSYLYLNSALILSSNTPGAGSANKFSFGLENATSNSIVTEKLVLTSPLGSVNFSKIITKTNTQSGTNFDPVLGVFAGAITKDAQKIGIIKEIDYLVGRKEGAIKQQKDIQGKTFSVWIGDNSQTSFSISHNLNTFNIHANLLDTSLNQYVFPLQIVDENTVLITFDYAPSDLQYLLKIFAF